MALLLLQLQLLQEVEAGVDVVNLKLGEIQPAAGLLCVGLLCKVDQFREGAANLEKEATGGFLSISVEEKTLLLARAKSGRRDREFADFSSDAGCVQLTSTATWLTASV